MATAISVIDRAMRLIRVKGAGESLSAEEYSDALGVLNAILAEMHEADIGLPDYQLDSVEDELASDIADREALAYELAFRVAPEFNKPISQPIQDARNAAMGRLRLRYFQPGCVDFSELPSVVSPFNINTGE